MHSTGRERIEAAFAGGGAGVGTGAVIPYEGIYIRDRWDEITCYPWWYQLAPDVERQLQWRTDYIERTGLDWVALPHGHSREARERLAIEERADGVFRVDHHTGEQELLERPPVGGSHLAVGEGVELEHLPETTEEVDALIPIPPETDPQELVRDGRADLAKALLQGPARDLYPICHVASPLWSCAWPTFGFEGMMTLVATRPDLIEHACRRLLTLALRHVREARALGARGIWIEECMTDMVSPRAFAALNLPYVRALVDEIRRLGMHSIYYYCGDPAGKWETLLAAGADALSLEESKKGFEIDIEEVVERVQGRCVVLGNLDAVGMLEQGSEQELRAEVERQLAAGRRNRGRFVASLGSPATPGTPVGRVRLYAELVHGHEGGRAM